MTLFELAKTIPAVDACERYTSAKLTKKGKHTWCCCPFHAEKTPSCSFADDRFYCFGCHEGGSSIDFVAKLFHLSARDAADKLCTDFALGTPPDKQYARKIGGNLTMLRQAFQNLDTICVGYRKWCDYRLAEISPDDESDETAGILAFLLEERENAQRISDELFDAPVERQAELLRKHGEWAAHVRDTLNILQTQTNERYWGTNK